MSKSKVKTETSPPYLTHGMPEDERNLVANALALLTARFCGNNRREIISPQVAGEFACLQLGALESEHFCAMWLDNRHRVIAWEVLSTGTIDGASVYPREVAKSALSHNAAAVIFAHNHPSGNPDPSAADRDITRRLRQSLDLFDIRTVDHVVIAGGKFISLAERGWL